MTDNHPYGSGPFDATMLARGVHDYLHPPAFLTLKPCLRKHYQGLPGSLISYFAEDARHSLRSHMLIYGHTPTPPAPATLTQEQLARDAGQLVQAHAVLDKLVDDTDRSQHSLLSRIQQIADESERLNKILLSQALNPGAGIVSCVEALKRRCEHHADKAREAGERVAELSERVRQLKERNERLHDAQSADGGSDLIRLREELTAERARYGTIVQRVEALIEERDGLKQRNLNQAKMILAAGGALDQAGVTGDCFDMRVGALIEDRDRCKALRADVVLPDVHFLLDKAGIPNGTLVERVRVAIERGQQPRYGQEIRDAVEILMARLGIEHGRAISTLDLLKEAIAKVPAEPKPRYTVRNLPPDMWEVVNPQGRVISTCAALADAQRICASRNGGL